MFIYKLEINDFVKQPGKISIFFTVLLLVVLTTSPLFSAHLCAGKIYDFSLFDKASSCGCSSGSHEGVSDDAKKSEGNRQYNPGNCCTDILLIERVVDVLLPASNAREAGRELPVFKVSFGESNNIIRYLKSYPPLLWSGIKTHLSADRDIHILVQSFLL